jgi:broad specificity phosphatase PhoE
MSTDKCENNMSIPEPTQTPRKSGLLLILVRHGETEGNVSKVWHGSEDAPLTERGRRQVQATAQRLKELHQQYHVDALYVSPLPRAQSTASAIAKAINIEPIVEPGLREFSIGDWEGRSFRELQQMENLWQRWNENPEFAPPNGESPITFTHRVAQVISELAARHPNQTVAIVSHGGVISNILARWLGEGPQDWARWDPPNCAITILRQVEGGWQPITVNDTRHLREIGVEKSVPAND